MQRKKSYQHDLIAVVMKENQIKKLFNAQVFVAMTEKFVHKLDSCSWKSYFVLRDLFRFTRDKKRIKLPKEVAFLIRFYFETVEKMF